ncbi:MAG: I78 family peptidase inhibitor [Celeribacter sp.]|jgi:hypothetical protein
MPMRMPKLMIAGVSLTLMAACGPAIPPVPETPEIVNPVASVPVGDPLVEREPDLCQLDLVRPYVGQTTAVIPTIGLDRTYRVVKPDDIVTQEYNPRRVNFHTDGYGTITRVACG